MKYAIRVTEILTRTIIIDDHRVTNVDDAIQIVMNAIDNCNIILTADDFSERDVSPADWTDNGVVPIGTNVEFYEHFDTTDVLIPEPVKDPFPKRIAYNDAKPYFKKCCVCGTFCDYTDKLISRMSIPKGIYAYGIARDGYGDEYIQREIVSGGEHYLGMLFSETPLKLEDHDPLNGDRKILRITPLNFVWMRDDAKSAVEFEEE